MPKWFTPPEIARMYRVPPGKVRDWIESCQLAAVNIAADAHGERPRWRVSEEAIADFEEARRPTLPAPKPTRRRQQVDIVRNFRGAV